MSTSLCVFGYWDMARTDCVRLGLSDFLRGKLVERLREEEEKEKEKRA